MGWYLVVFVWITDWLFSRLVTVWLLLFCYFVWRCLVKLFINSVVLFVIFRYVMFLFEAALGSYSWRFTVLLVAGCVCC